MDSRIRQAFDGVHAPEELKDRTRAFLAEKAGARRTGRRPAARRLIPALACVLLVLVGLTSWGVYFSPTSAISIDVNPSVELEINRFDKVISVVCYGVKEEEQAQWQDLRFHDYRDAVSQLLASGTIAACLEQEEPLSISVVSEDGERQAEILENVRTCAGGQGNIHCYAADSSQVEHAHQAGVSFGKYQAFLYLQELDPSVTAEQVQEMTMAEIRQRIAELTGNSSAMPQQGGGGQSGGEMSGHGYGHRYGWGHDGDHERTQ
jgi:hypothetical protein